MQELISAEEKAELEQERFNLALERIAQIPGEKECGGAYEDYFAGMAKFVLFMKETWDFVAEGRLYTASMEELQAHNKALYEDILPENYAKSYADPAYAAACFGTDMGRLLAFLYAELRYMIVAAYEQSRFNMVIRMELLLEIYQLFTGAEEGVTKEALTEEIKQAIYWYISDYYEEESAEKIGDILLPEKDFACRIIMEKDLTDLRYLYYFGEYISENELQTARHMNELPEETIRLMADTYTEGYRIGFETGNKDISIKKTVNIRYALGFERMIRAAVDNFDAIGLKPTIYRNAQNIFRGFGVNKVGYYGADPNKQFDYDHKEDLALFLDKQLSERRLECLQNVWERFKKEAGVFGGPACQDTFGETPFVPQSKEAAAHLSDKQQKMTVEFVSKAGVMQNRYMKGEETSFTIIAFPVPDIGEKYDEIFDEIIRINTLDYKLYRRIQQTIIDTLDQGDYVLIKGMGNNRTDLKVNLHTLAHPEKETNFENCVADVNIPVGEVFTSPLLAGTEGVLHVTRVFLHGLEYKDFLLRFADGMVRDYSCANFQTEEENRKYIKDNVLHHHESLPIGEFAIGTNTTAYVAARKYGIEDKLPILIAEKTGPHFAVGDTCYSHAEEVRVYNPDGKEIVAKDNEISLLRDEDMTKAYFNCHTDVTIPYDELGELSVVAKSGEVIPIIIEGRFVLAGTETLNEAFS
ncbi:MAG: aminopeptidase [Roseburia sp.]|nr:aminopeptidase [Roseburia sp.]MCM1241993.1 aminopeptidase [Roseburia sp.]